MKEYEIVKKYWSLEKTVLQFDSIYNNKVNILNRFINKVLRKGMRERVALALQECKGNNKTVLDIGCGSGRIALLLADKGMKVTGIDYSSKMIELANEYLRKYEASKNTKSNVEFIHCDFMRDFDSNELFDITLALGVFDYIKDPIPFLEKMKNVTKEKTIASYPAKFTPQMLLRKVWLWTRNCPVYFYTESKLKAMYTSIGITNYKIIKLSAGYLVIADLSEK